MQIRLFNIYNKSFINDGKYFQQPLQKPTAKKQATSSASISIGSPTRITNLLTTNGFSLW